MDYTYLLCTFGLLLGSLIDIYAVEVIFNASVQTPIEKQKIDLTCLVKTDTKTTIQSISIRILNTNTNKSDAIAIFSPLNMSRFTDYGTYLKGRVTLTSPIDNLRMATLSFNEIHLEDANTYLCNVVYENSKDTGLQKDSDPVFIQILRESEKEGLHLPVYAAVIITGGIVGLVFAVVSLGVHCRRKKRVKPAALTERPSQENNLHSVGKHFGETDKHNTGNNRRDTGNTCQGDDVYNHLRDAISDGNGQPLNEYDHIPSSENLDYSSVNVTTTEIEDNTYDHVNGVQIETQHAWSCFETQFT